MNTHLTERAISDRWCKCWFCDVFITKVIGSFIGMSEFYRGVCVCLCVCVVLTVMFPRNRFRRCLSTNIQTYKHSYLCTYIHSYIHVDTHTHTHQPTHTHTHTHTRTRTRTHARSRRRRQTDKALTSFSSTNYYT